MRGSFQLRGLTVGALALLGLAACEPVTTAPVQPTLPGPSDACGASGYQGLIGQPRQVLAAMKFPLATRVIGPDEAVTADYSEGRLNIEYGRGGLIEKISCY